MCLMVEKVFNEWLNGGAAAVAGSLSVRKSALSQRSRSSCGFLSSRNPAASFSHLPSCVRSCTRLPRPRCVFAPLAPQMRCR